MTKKNYVTLILSTIGGFLFAIGMCMAMLPEWNAFVPGTVCGGAGLVILLAMVLIRRRMEGKAILVKLTAKTVGAILLGLAGTLAFGGGMCLVMVWERLIAGIIVGMIGILMLLCLIPVVKGIE